MTAIGTTYNGGGAELLERILPLVDYIETTPDTIARVRRGRPEIDAMALETLREIARHARLLVHGVGLSIGSHDGWCDDYLRLIEPLFDSVDVAWHSEHLGYTHVDGRSLGTMLVLPRTNEVLDLICPRIEAIQRRFAVPFLVENVVSLIPEAPGHDYSPAEFLNEVTRRTGCGLLLDVYNLECDARNIRLDIARFLDELDFAAIGEIHIANGVEERGLMLDVHSRRTRPETLALTSEVLRRAENAKVVIFELLPQAIPAHGAAGIAEEIISMRARFAA